MAITKEIIVDKIEVVGVHKAIQVATATVIKEDGKEISRSRHRHVVHSDQDISGEDAEVQSIANIVWTDEVKASWQALLDEAKD
jgi:hypothetical protein